MGKGSAVVAVLFAAFLGACGGRIHGDGVDEATGGALDGDHAGGVVDGAAGSGPAPGVVAGGELPWPGRRPGAADRRGGVPDADGGADGGVAPDASGDHGGSGEPATAPLTGHTGACHGARAGALCTDHYASGVSACAELDGTWSATPCDRAAAPAGGCMLAAAGGGTFVEWWRSDDSPEARASAREGCEASGGTYVTE